MTVVMCVVKCILLLFKPCLYYELHSFTLVLLLIARTNLAMIGIIAKISMR